MIPFSTNVLYEPIPFELLRTVEDKPQLIVEVDGLPAVCHGLACDFSFVEAVGVITSFTFTEATSLLTVVGTNLTTNMTEIQNLTFAHAACVIDEATLTATGFQCTLDRAPTCGSYAPELITIHGKIPVEVPGGANTTTIQCTITSVAVASSSNDLNWLGSDSVVLTGTNFPLDL